ncbi:MAG TPA: peptidoglycan DD-metalloendopeptidase family protein [Sphingomicrobium sp.]|nr:peptidoglycan DD-metalloendopeptidase family protein [Sphingomicrobium sp.]
MIRQAALLLLVAGSATVAASAPRGAARSAMDSELRQALEDAASAQAEQRRLEAAAAKARDQALRLRAEQLAAAEAIAAAEARITAADARFRLIQAYLAEQRRRLAAEQAPVRSLLTGLVLMARRPPVLVVADSGSMGELVKLRRLLASTAPAIQARTAALSSALEQGSRLERAAIDARQAMVQTRRELEDRRLAFAALEARALRLAQERGAEALGAGDVALARREELAEIRREAPSRTESRRLAAELAALGPAPVPRGGEAEVPPLRYRLPADAPVTDGMGAVSAAGVRSRGVTLGTRRGAQLVAPASGKILFAGPFRDYDGVIIIDHGRGWKSVVVNAGSGFKRGETVEIGEPLGTALGPVEVQLRRGGRSISPALIAGSSTVLSNRKKSG